MADLSDYRREIDELDKELVALFEKRMNVVKKVAQYKKENNLEVFHKDRENIVFEKAVACLKDKSYTDEVIKFINATMEIGKGVQQRIIDDTEKMTKLDIKRKEIDKTKLVAYPGVAGAFSEEAAIRVFGEDSKRTAYEDFEDVCNALKEGKVDYGILPIENSSTGAISDTYDLLRKYGFFIIGEKCIKIEQNLVGIEGTKLSDIEEVYSHTQGIRQCSEFLKGNKDWVLIPYHNTAVSAKHVKELNDKSKVAIASKTAAKLYGLNVIEEGINNQNDNYTRFVAITRKPEVSKDANKVSVVFSLENEAGTLYRLLSYFAENNINMIKIESRPMKNESWKYFLYVDFEGDIADESVNNALKLIEQNSAYFRLLGAYKKNID
ncbi:chorismate mutase [Clostridium sp. DSM 8431]|uniref:prephenate dehydratase n=1 Tax=Clostridium sp. DSM 8431 TaxID=1761781 RepID=UPI0008E02DEE|nr:prephenate dehydratase [Clostridium sp. DSM 8431]SFU67476.1 chorismate mutase [Clostridium sp. DSM 8431]